MSLTPFTVAHAADADAGSTAEQITITARHDTRLLAVQAAPAAITALSGEKLAEQGITNIRELGTIVPNLFQTKVAVSYLNTNIFIRGIGEPDPQGEPSVGLYIDGIYVPKDLGAQQELLDIDQVTVYRGPQGQAFGHSAEAGAILIETNTPTATPHFKAQASYGSFNDVRLGVAASGPLFGDLYGGVAVSYHRRDGLNENVTLNRETNNIDNLTGRTKLRYAPNDRFDVTLSLSGIHDRSTARGVENLLYNDTNAHSQIFPAQKFDQLSASLTLNYRINDHLKVTSITGAYGFDQKVLFDNTGDYYGRGAQWVHYTDKTYQEELRLTGDYGPFDFTAGIYAYREDWFTNRRANTAANATNVAANILYRPVYSLIQQDTDNLAGYVEAHYAVTDRLKLTAGVRNNWERHSNENHLYNLVAASPYTSNVTNFLTVLFAQPQALVWQTNVNKSWDSWSPKGSIDFKWTPDVLQYATISQGAKSGGFDYRAQTPTANGRLQALLPYDPETVTNYETGFKTQWWDRRITANVSVFYERFDDIQLTTTDPATTISRRFNAGQGSTRGIEFEGSAVPIPGLQFDLSGSYLHARLDHFVGNAPTISQLPNGQFQRSGPFSGAVLPYSPTWQGRFATTWNLPIKIPGLWAIQGAVSYQTASYTDTTNNFSSRLPEQVYLDAQIRYTTPSGRWTAALSAENLGNKQYALPPGYSPSSTGAPLYESTNYNDPRTVLFTITYKN